MIDLLCLEKKINKLFSGLDEQADLKVKHSFMQFNFCLYMADPATSLASNSSLGTNEYFRVPSPKKTTYYTFNIVSIAAP